MLKKTALTLAVALSAWAAPALAVQETFTDLGPLDCSSIKWCKLSTGDGLFTLRFRPSYPLSGASAAGFELRQKTVEIRAAGGGLLDLGSMALSLTGSNSYNGANFIGAVALETQDAAGAWSAVTQWSSWVDSPLGIYVIFNGHNIQSPWVKGVKAVRLSATNGATAFRIGMMNLTAH